MDFNSESLLDGLSSLKEGSLFSFVYKTPMKNYTLTSVMASTFHKETKQTMIAELDLLLEDISVSLTDEKLRTMYRGELSKISQSLQDGIRGISIILNSYKDDYDTIEYLNSVISQLNDVVARIDVVLKLDIFGSRHMCDSKCEESSPSVVQDVPVDQPLFIEKKEEVKIDKIDEIYNPTKPKMEDKDKPVTRLNYRLMQSPYGSPYSMNNPYCGYTTTHAHPQMYTIHKNTPYKAERLNITITSSKSKC